MADGESTGLELHDDWMRVHFGNGLHADFHYRWLRHNCDRERHPITNERTLCSSELPDDVRPRRAALAGDRLEVTWAPDDHASTYALSWLAEHAYARNRAAVPPPPADLARIEIHGEGLSRDEQVARALAHVRDHGAAVVRSDAASARAPEDATEPLILAFEAAGMRIIPTHFGRLEDLRTDNTTNNHTDQLGYTDAPVHLHTDQPFLDPPPRYQVLQCIRAAEQGGDNLLADARAAFRYLQSLDARAAAVLAEVPVRFHRRQKKFERELVAPIITRADDDHFFVRASYFTLAPHRLDFDVMSEFYRAHDRFMRLMRDPRHHYHARLEPGDWLLYDNHRMLHARTGFSGARWLRGIYFDHG
jgi:gamma-butyrobetaine dioxygenase/trimethyllysine dioxygenase